MKKSVLGLILAVVLIAVVVGVVLINKPSDNKESTTSNTNTHSTTTTNSQTNDQPGVESNSVEISNFTFKSSKITVKKGTTVTWTNKDSIGHTVTPDSESNDFKGSELLGRNESYSFTFNKAGTYTYHCRPHPNMTGTIEVTE